MASTNLQNGIKKQNLNVNRYKFRMFCDIVLPFVLGQLHGLFGVVVVHELHESKTLRAPAQWIQRQRSPKTPLLASPIPM